MATVTLVRYQRIGRYQFIRRSDDLVVVAVVGRGIPLDVFPTPQHKTLYEVATEWVSAWA